MRGFPPIAEHVARHRHAFAAAWRTYRTGGVPSVSRKAVRILNERMGGNRRDVFLLAQDIVHSSTLPPFEPPPAIDPGRRLRIGWIMTPPAPGSGGHTTAFRMVEALEAAGHDCRLLLYDFHGGDLGRHAAVIRRCWPFLKAEIRDVTRETPALDACFATSWESAHVLAARFRAPMHRFYFVQDYEPYFYPRGWEYELAADSYRFGFRCIALGAALSRMLRDDAGVPSAVVTFGCDLSTYGIVPGGERSGIAFFARPDFARRGYLLGRSVVERFHERFPGQPIHVFGAKVNDIAAPVVQHGKLSPVELNELYNGVVAGIVPSFTNVSLVPEEMLRAGAIPVCNVSEGSKSVVSNPNVRWAAATPDAFVRELADVLSHDRPGDRAAEISRSVEPGRSWDVARRELLAIVEGVAYGHAARR